MAQTDTSSSLKGVFVAITYPTNESEANFSVLKSFVIYLDIVLWYVGVDIGRKPHPMVHLKVPDAENDHKIVVVMPYLFVRL